MVDWAKLAKVPKQPNFKVEGKTKDSARVFLHCSLCEKRIREIGADESIRVDRAYLCTDCDPSQKIIIANN